MDYSNYPYAPADGYRSFNQYLTVGLFLETHRGQEHIKPRYSLGEADVTVDGVVYPSARLIYIQSKGEHDAMCKLVGSFKQWCELKELAWFRECWEMWHAEWLMLQGQDARGWLKVHSMKSPGAAAALFRDAKTAPGAGRPRKPKVRNDDSGAIEDDVDRVVRLRQ